jgi:hypothetical protein
MVNWMPAKSYSLYVTKIPGFGDDGKNHLQRVMALVPSAIRRARIKWHSRHPNFAATCRRPNRLTT